jgi:trehalose/maltose hydrolase-like predicted phosphorylase
LEEENAADDPWILETTAPESEGHRDAFIGNGYIGQRIGKEGDAFSLPPDHENASGPSSSLVHGLWGEHRLIPPPRGAILTYHDGLALFSGEAGTWRNYRQWLDLKAGILRTELDWENEGRTTHIESSVYISRTRPNVCVLSRTIRPDFDGVVTITDELNGGHLTDATDWRDEEGEKAESPMSLEVTLGPHKRRVVVLSRLVLEGIAEPGVVGEKSVKRVSRALSFKVAAGRSYTVTKVVALVTDQDSPGPRVTAWTQAEGAARDLERLKRDHIDAWADLWRHRVAVSSPRLQKVINASLYQFYSQLRAGGSWSLGPTGLSGNYWGGHAFWDSDLWMFPALALLNPALAKGFIDYRVQTLEGARRNARADGYEGAMIAWESAEFGDETIPHLVYHHQHHVNSDVALAQWWFWKISGDDVYLREKSAEVIIECARFWASRVVHNEKLDRYEIHGVCCADEFAEIQDNNAYTNYSAAKTLRLAQAVSEKLGWPVPPQWEEIANKLWIPFDEKNQRYIEYEGYVDQTIKQADTALLIYPYEMPMAREIKANVVDFYRDKYPADNIMMAAAFDGIVDCELGRADKAWESLGKLMPHFREPYLLVSESPGNEVISFATGLGGLLQLIVMGFAGIRIHEDGLQIQPCLPSAISYLRLVGIHHGGVCFDLRLEGGKVVVENPSSAITFRIENAKGESWIG